MNLKLFNKKHLWKEILELSSLSIIILYVLLYSFDSLSLSYINEKYYKLGNWIFNIIFTIEYATRIFLTKYKKKYIFSFWGIIDFLSVIVIFIEPLQIFRLIRLFKLLRILNYFNYKNDRLFEVFFEALAEIKVLLFGVFLVACILIYIFSAIVYYFENPLQPETFSSIFASLWWCVITLTTVGYGDMIPQSVAGKIITTILLFLGIALFSIPTALIASSMLDVKEKIRLKKKKD